MKILVIITFSILIVISCKTVIEKNVYFGDFEITLPEDWTKVRSKGIDSYVGKITNGIDTLTFDYGWYSGDFSHENRDKQLFAYDTINGKIALLTKPKSKGNGTTGIFIEKAYDKNKFILKGKNIMNEELALNIFKSIKFKNSDPKINSKNIRFTDKIKPDSGRSLFKKNCAACHYINKDAFGPAFASISKSRFEEWMLDFDNLIEGDTSKFGINYHKKTFGKYFTKNDINKLINYSKIE